MDDKIKCKKCGALVSKFRIKQHERQCSGDITKFRGRKKRNYVIINDEAECPYCHKKYNKYGIANHIYLHEHKDGSGKGISRPNSGPKNGCIPWNKGLTKETDERVKRNGESVSAVMIGKPGRPHTKETKEKISKALSKNNHGGRCKWYEVSGIKVQGTWERNVAEHMDELGIKWTKLKTHKDTYAYIKDGLKRHYTPDFKLDDFNIILELKGYWWGDDKRKMELVFEQNEITNLYIIEKDKYKLLLLSKSIDEFLNVIK